MKLNIGTAHELISNMRTYFQVNSPKQNYIKEEPLRSELYSSDQMDQFGKQLAETHKLTDKPATGQLLNRLADNEMVLNEVRKLLVEAINEKSTITPAGEWLIDNFYLIEEQIRTAKKHLPKGYNETLPQLQNVDTLGMARVYDIALQIISHSDGRIDLERLSSYIKAYQSVCPLQLGELWAIPIMLRLTLIENLRRVSAMIAIDRLDKNLADYWAIQMLVIAERDPKSLILITSDMARSKPPMVSAFVSEMSRQLLGKGPALALSLTWIEQRLNEDGQTINELVNAEIQKQAINQVSVSNSIGSLRMLSSLDWRDFVEAHSVVEQTLKKDINGIYARMDFSTRDHYRHVVEHVAKKAKISEKRVAELAIEAAAANINAQPPEDRKAHVGYYLVGKGLPELKKAAGMKKTFAGGFRKMLDNHRLVSYLGSIFLITVIITASFLLKADNDTETPGMILLIGVLLLLSSSQLAITVVNFFSTLLVRPNMLPRMDFSRGIPRDSRSLIIIPSMLTGLQSIEDLVEALEVRYLANKDKNLFFGLLTDFTDAATETLPGDEPLLQLAKARIEALKEKYEDGNNEIFFLFHRPRRWNQGEKVWMGYERKRGKLEELNDLLRGEGREKFSCIVGDTTELAQVKFVITLDSDTQLPRGAAWKMVATMAHPLNRAVYDEKRQRVTEGYGILQPRVSVSLPEASSSFYNKLHGNEAGIDPYTRATSDVYQDLFQEGSFIGKGIYDVAIFEKTLKGRFRENRILSHDLLEGSYVRSGLISDVELYEKYPMSYRLDMKRRSRWIRGDWQIFAWFLPLVPGGDNKIHKNPLSALSKWKIFDNIRRSLISLSLTMLIILGWTVLSAPLFWTLAVSGIIVFPILVTLAWDAFKKPDDVIISHHLKMFLRTTRNIVVQTLFSVICLPYEAFVNVLAIARTIWRILVSHRKLLEWDPSTNKENKRKNGLTKSYTTMWIAPVVSFLILVDLCIYYPMTLLFAGPVLLLWMLSPLATWLASQPSARQEAVLTEKQHIFLRKTARKTWGFFEAFVGPADNWLAPDNFQQHPVAVIAHRTSPTNIGLSLLANLTANDFGYIGVSTFIERTVGTINTLKKLERYRGHFYNWYDTETLQPLLPKYISTVDSGNLAGHLLTFRQGIFELLYQPIAGRKIFDGLMDTLNVLKERLDKADVAHLAAFTTRLESFCTVRPDKLSEMNAALQELVIAFDGVAKNLKIEKESTTDWWQGMFKNQLKHAVDDLQMLAPWFALPAFAVKFINVIDIDTDISLNKLNKRAKEIIAGIDAMDKTKNTIEENAWLDEFKPAVAAVQAKVSATMQQLELLGHECIGLAAMEWEFLYDTSRHLLTIGYRVEDHTCDPGYYDLLASEARLCSFLAIAQGSLPEETWFALGRLLTTAGGGPVLLSWSGSMFEYLMPLLVMPTYDNTLLDQTYKSTVNRQIEYGKQRGVPWGVSESGYNMVDASSNYQYQAFGVPGLGLKRGLEADLVIAPYATALSLMVAPEEACKNLELMAAEGFEGAYGFYEAIDYTASRQQRGQTYTVIQSFMAHHQGMSLLSLSYLLHGQPMQRRFEAEPQFQATLLLLQERIPKATSFYAHTTDLVDFSTSNNETEIRIINKSDTLIPEVQLLSNGKYHMMVTNSGGGYSRWKDTAVTRWREDTTCDNFGTFCYIRDLDSGEFWSNTHQPTLKKGKTYEVAFSQGRVDFHGSYNNIETHTEIVISPEDDIEMRRMHVNNKSSSRRTIEITSYAEVVLAPQAADVMQPAFSNLFVQTEILPTQHAILCSRRPRAANEHNPWMFHSMIVHGADKFPASYETDRMEFLGHGNTVANPKVMNTRGPLSGSQGSVLDPIVAIRYTLVLEPGDNIAIDCIIGIGDSREVCEKMIEKYHDKHHKDRVFELAWTHSQVILRQINATYADEQLFSRLAGSVIFTNQSLRANASVIIKNHRGQSGLWGYSISGDLPIVLLQIADQSNLLLAKQLIQAHTYWRLKGLIVDLVIWNEDHGGYRQVFQNQIQALIPTELIDKSGGIFVRAADQISNEDRILFQTVARVNICDVNGTLADHINRRPYAKSLIPYLVPQATYVPRPLGLMPRENLTFNNGMGGYSEDGKEYIINTDRKNRTPVAWVNVIANPNFGTVVTESGQAYTWVDNAHEMRLTPWNNDTVSDTGGEAFYLRDEDTGHFWAPTPLPGGGLMPYITRHGFGYSVFEHLEDGIYSEMSVFVDIEAPVKFTVIKVRNESDRARKLSTTGYTEWVLGDVRTKTAMHVITELGTTSGTFFGRNPYSTEFANRVAFFDVDENTKTVTGDRTEFIGRNGNLQNPDAMRRVRLSGKVGVALDPCAAIQVPFELAPGEEKTIIFRLGAGRDMNNAAELANSFRGQDAARIALEKVKNYWEKATTVIKVQTPDPAINMLANGWLTYQTLACRVWGRSGYYQSGGAFGFRDQLQDMLSLLHAEPELAKKQILLSATRQFKEGDVQHWWHPPVGRGVRTRISDDYLWLPFVTSRYVSVTGDYAILDEQLGFLEGRQLNAGEESYYDLPAISDQVGTLYDHCVRAIQHGLTFGAHGLPLMGTGDWNDGMDRVGNHGKGESVWLGFFLFDVLNKFTEVAAARKDNAFEEQCKREAATLKDNIEKNGWDGEWYRRAYFDDGTPLGSATNDECQIDSLPQSWSVLAALGNKERSVMAMKLACERLVDKDANVVKLFNPPFDKSTLDPGYIKGYVPGVRENGGQYTHAAVWMVMAFARLGDTARTWELLQMINPVNHGRTSEEIAVYKVEPYVVAADVYGMPPHSGRGGWTWYSGSASWMYQLITDLFLGLQVTGDKLRFQPCIPAEWDAFTIDYRYKDTTYTIQVKQNTGFGVMVVQENGTNHEDLTVTLVDDKKEHKVDVLLFSGTLEVKGA